MMIITSWFAKNQKQIKLEVFEYEASAEFVPGLFDIGINFEIDGLKCTARAQAFNRDLALEKACAEGLERLAFAFRSETLGVKGETSSGYATHKNFQNAALRARRELIERDILMCNILTGASFPILNINRLKNIRPQIQRLPLLLKKQGVEMLVASLYSDYNQKIVICATFGAEHAPSFGANVGFGVSSQILQATEKAVQECLMMSLEPICGGKTKALSLKNFKLKKKHDFIAHRALGLHREIAKDYRARFIEMPNARVVKKASARIEKGFTYLEMPLPNLFKTCPGVVVRALNPLLQPVIIGLPRPSNVNHDRIESFLRNVSEPSLELDYKNIHILA